MCFNDTITTNFNDTTNLRGGDGITTFAYNATYNPTYKKFDESPNDTAIFLVVFFIFIFGVVLCMTSSRIRY
jgi:hypothetical protein